MTLVLGKWPLLVFLAVRVVSVALVQTWFVPDEYWQATEVAHAMAFRYGYITWEWKEGIRGVLYPAVFGALFKLLFVLGIDSTYLLIHLPRFLHAVAFAIGDYHIWKLSNGLYGNVAAKWTVVCLSTSWFLSYCAPRTLTSCIETMLLAVAFTNYPWKTLRDTSNAGYLWPVGLACAVRPTAAVPFVPLTVRHLFHCSRKTTLILHYLIIMTAVGSLTVTLDSWYYGEVTVVPWKFLHFNVVTGLSSHYGTHSWHWYLSQGLPVTLTTHLVPFILAVYSQPTRHKHLLHVILWSLFVYSCLGHKEFRFLLPVLPLCLCMAGDYIAFHLTAYRKKLNHSVKNRRIVIFLVLLIPNLCALLYLGLIHQRGPLDTMQVLQREVDSTHQVNILFLMPCHSTPFYSHLHRNVKMRYLTCEPNLKLEENYLDEADLFDQDPMTWLQQEYGEVPPVVSVSDGEMKMDWEHKKSKLVENKVKGHYQNEGYVNFKDKEIKISKAIVSGETKFQDYVGKIKTDEEHSKRNKEAIGEEGNITTLPHSGNLPSHIVMFSVLRERVTDFLSSNHYYLCHQLFHSHISDGRRSQYIFIYCWHPSVHKSHLHI